MVFVPKGQYDCRQARSAWMLEFGRFQSVARSGQNTLAQGLPRVYPGLVENKRFALKGLETRTRSVVPSRLSPYLVAPSGLFGWGELPRVNPGLRSLGHFGPRIGRMTDEAKILRRDLL
jgi:hypothetical protein